MNNWIFDLNDLRSDIDKHLNKQFDEALDHYISDSSLWLDVKDGKAIVQVVTSAEIDNEMVSKKESLKNVVELFCSWYEEPEIDLLEIMKKELEESIKVIDKNIEQIKKGDVRYV